MIKEVFVLNRDTFSVETAFIDPDTEWRLAADGDRVVKIYNDMNPETKARTGFFHRESDVFSDKEDGAKGLCEHISKLIEKNNEEVFELTNKNAKLHKLLKDSLKELRKEK